MRIQLALLLALAGLLSGCFDNPGNETDGDDTGGDDLPMTPTPPATETHNVSLSGAYPVNIAYEPNRIEVGNNTNVTINFTNDDQNPVMNHDWVLEDVEGAATEVIPVGETSSVTFLAPAPGSYLFYCSVPGHRGNGMEGEFVVTA